MKNVTLLLDTKTYGRKPNQKTIEQNYIKDGKKVKLSEAACTNIRLTKNQVTISVEQLIEKILAGYTWSLSHFKKDEYGNIHRTKACWQGQDVFALDIDEGITPDEALERCTYIGIMPTFMYTSFSDTQQLRKFRLVFISEKTVTDYRDAYATTIALMYLFPECDKQCKDPNRFYYGGKELLYKNLENKISPKKVIDALCSHEFIKEPKTYKRQIKKFSSKVALNLENDLPKICANYANCIYNIIELEKFPQIFEYCASVDEVINNCTRQEDGNLKKTFKYANENAKTKQQLKRHFDYNELEKNCPLWNGFINGTIFPFEPEMMGIALNILKLEGGEKKLKQAIKKMPYADEATRTYYSSKLGYWKNFNGISRCADFCPRFSNKERVDEVAAKECNNCINEGLNMLNVVTLKRGNIRKIEDSIEVLSLELAENKTEQAIREALENTDEGIINVVVSPTGIGKSTMLQKISEERYSAFNNTLICVPTHKLALELKDKLSQYTGLLYVGEPLISDSNIQSQFVYFQSVGAYSEAIRVLRNYRQNLMNTSSEHEEEIQSIKSYLEAIKEVKSTNKPILCTHTKMFNLNNSNIKKVIIDEDIVKALLPTFQIDIDKVEIVMNRSKEYGLNNLYSQLATILKFLKEIRHTHLEVFEPPTQLGKIPVKDIKKLLEIKVPNFNIIDLLSLKAVVVKDNIITAYKRNNLPRVPITILSATANKVIYEKIFKCRSINMTEIKKVDMVGKIILHPNLSMCKTKLEKNFTRYIEIIKKEAPNIKNIITFKQCISKFSKEDFNVICNYWGCCGLDAFGGQDLIVAGTPNCNEVAYLLLAHACGVKEKINMEMEYVPVERNGFQFFFNTFNSNDKSEVGELIREIQFYLIESELIQAIGRARALRNNCTVHVFSNLLLGNCNIYGEEPIKRKIIQLEDTVEIEPEECFEDICKDPNEHLKSLFWQIYNSVSRIGINI